MAYQGVSLICAKPSIYLVCGQLKMHRVMFIVDIVSCHASTGCSANSVQLCCIGRSVQSAEHNSTIDRASHDIDNLLLIWLHDVRAGTSETPVSAVFAKRTGSADCVSRSFSSGRNITAFAAGRLPKQIFG